MIRQPSLAIPTSIPERSRVVRQSCSAAFDARRPMLDVLLPVASDRPWLLPTEACDPFHLLTHLSVPTEIPTRTEIIMSTEISSS
jgi:hypothetical protein